jgi:hypothetical protein
MNPWLVIVIVIACLIVLSFISGLFFFFLLKKQSPKVDAELEKMLAYEKERGSKLIDKVKLLYSKGLRYDKDSIDKMEEYFNNLENLDSTGRAQYKNMVDFSALFLYKVYNEDKRLSKYISEQEANYFKDFQKDSDLKYKAYNKKASVYNTFLNMPFTKMVMRMFKQDTSPKAVL